MSTEKHYEQSVTRLFVPLSEQIKCIAETYNITDISDVLAYAAHLPEHGCFWSPREIPIRWCAFPAEKYAFRKAPSTSYKQEQHYNAILVGAHALKQHMDVRFTLRKSDTFIAPDPRTKSAFERILKMQDASIYILPVQLGVAHAGRTPDEALHTLESNEFGLTLFQCETIALTHAHLVTDEHRSWDGVRGGFSLVALGEKVVASNKAADNTHSGTEYCEVPLVHMWNKKLHIGMMGHKNRDPRLGIASFYLPR